MARRMWEHLFLMAVEMAHAPRKIHWTNWRDYIDLVRKDLLVSMLIDDRPTMLVCGHFGNFELSGYVLALLGFPSSTIARPLDNRHLDRFVNELRESHGQFIIPKNGSAAAGGGLAGRGRHSDAAGRSACRRQRLLGQFFWPAGVDAQSGRPVGPVERDADGGLLLPARRPTAQIPAGRRPSDRSAARCPPELAQCAGADGMVYRSVGRDHSRRARAILVGPSPLERIAAGEARVRRERGLNRGPIAASQESLELRSPVRCSSALHSSPS